MVLGVMIRGPPHVFIILSVLHMYFWSFVVCLSALITILKIGLFTIMLVCHYFTCVMITKSIRMVKSCPQLYMLIYNTSDETCEVTDNHQSEDGDVILPVTHVNKELTFDDTLVFVTLPLVPFIASHSSPVDMNDCQAYLSLVSDVLSSGLPNYLADRVPIPSVFNWDYLQKHIRSYHDGRLLDYLKFGFPLGIGEHERIVNNAKDNPHSTLPYAKDIDAFFEKELQEGALFGLFDVEPHPAFTWSPLMSRPKGTGRRVILDLSYGDNSVNVHTTRDLFDTVPFKLTLPSLDNMLPTLQRLGKDARVLR